MDNEAPGLAEKQSAKINKHGGKRANSGRRRSGAGGKKGIPNKLTADVKADHGGSTRSVASGAKDPFRVQVDDPVTSRRTFPPR